MPYPDGDHGMETPTQQEEKLSGTEKHWNQVCMGIATIATALLGATLLIAGFTEQDSGEHGQFEVLKALFTLFAAALYLIVLQNLGKVIFPNPRQDRKTRLEHRRRWASSMFATFAALAATTALVVLLTAYPGFLGQIENDGADNEIAEECPTTQMQTIRCPRQSVSED